jgi:glycosyltransferase involved in cell wall biosynthesis
MSIRYIYWFALFGPSSPSVRYRGLYPLEQLQKRHGINYSIAYPGYDPYSVFRFIKMYFSALLFRKPGSLIVIQRVYTNRLYSNLLKLLIKVRKSYTLYDIDDAEYVPHSPETIRYFIANCSACSVGSAELFSYSRAYNPNSFMLTSPVTMHSERKIFSNRVFTIGWVGCFWGAHRESLYSLFFPALRYFPVPVKVVILGARSDEHRDELIRYFADSKNVELDIPCDIDWFDETDIYRRISRFDIGVSPLLDTEINRAKSAYKLKQYFSCGVPALCSNIGENSVFLEPGLNGFFCDTAEGYRDGIMKMMLLNCDEYQCFSSHALSSVKKFDLDHYCFSLIGHFENLD